MNPIIALFVRSLRQDSKSVYSHLLRGGLAAFLLFWIWTFVRESWFRSAPGRQVFQAISMINVWFITVAAIGYFATSITEEKEEKTLGLMQMAGISPLGLLFGKSISRLWLALVLLAIQLPFTLLAVTMGGVTLRQIFATYVTLAAYTYFLSGVATFISVASRRSFAAVCGMFGFLVLFFLMGSLTGAFQDLIDSLRSPALSENVASVLGWLDAVLIWRQLDGVMTITFNDPIIGRHFVASTIAGSLFFVMGWLSFGFFANRHVDSSISAVGWMMRRLVLPKPRAWGSAPLTWKDFFFNCGGGTGWLIRGFFIVVAGLLFSLPLLNSGFGRVDSEFVGAMMVWSAMAVAAVEATVQSIRFVSAEQSDKTLQLLGMLPRSPASILYSKLVGYLLGLVPAFGTFLCGLLLLMATDDLDMPRHADEVLGVTYGCLLVVVFLHLNVLLSTYIKWGAAPVSFGILVMINICCVFTIEMGGGPGGRSSMAAVFFVLNLVAMGVTAGLQAMIGSRFQELAGR